jgi:hypothetical protein
MLKEKLSIFLINTLLLHITLLALRDRRNDGRSNELILVELGNLRFLQVNTCTGAGFPCTLYYVGISMIAPIPPRSAERTNSASLILASDGWEWWEREHHQRDLSHHIPLWRVFFFARMRVCIHACASLCCTLTFRMVKTLCTMAIFKISVTPHPPKQLLSPEHVFLALQKNLSSQSPPGRHWIRGY